MKNQMRMSVCAIALSVVVIFSSCGPQQEKQAASEEKTSSQTIEIEKTQEKSPVFKDEKVANVYERYQHLKNALVKTDAAEAQKTATELQSALTTLSADGKGLEFAKQIASSTDVEAQRKAFSPLSDAISELIKTAELSSGKIYLAFCPMANGNAGAFWLSNQKEIRNPYFGDKMMKCGSVKETIVANK